MNYNVLVINEFRVIRRLIKSYLATEFGKWQVETAQNSKDALALLRFKKYSLVFADYHMQPIPFGDFYATLRSFDKNKSTPVAIIGPKGSLKDNGAIQADPLTSFLISPFSADQLRQVVVSVQDPRELRTLQRFNLEEGEASLMVGAVSIKTKVINFSLGGMMVQINQPMGDLLTHAVQVNLKLSLNGAGHEIGGIVAAPVRFIVLRWDEESHAPISYRAAWKFVSLNDEARRKLEQVIDWVKADLLKTEKSAELDQK